MSIPRKKTFTDMYLTVSVVVKCYRYWMFGDVVGDLMLFLATLMKHINSRKFNFQDPAFNILGFVGNF